jgi:hypothetical protein
MSLSAVFIGRRRVVVCADSRTVGTETGRICDRNEKLFQAGERSACGIGALINVGPRASDFVPNRIKKLCIDERLRDRPRELLSAIKDDIWRPLSRLFIEEPGRFKSLLPDQQVIFVAFCLTRRAMGEIDLLELRLPMLANQRGEPSLGEPEIESFMDGFLPAGPVIYSIGRANDLALQINPDLSDEPVLFAADRLFAAAAAHDQEVGGPVDVAAIDEQGFRWLRKKSSVATYFGAGNL